MSFGDPASKMNDWTLNPKESEVFVKRGTNFFDAANIYSGGTSEEYVIRAIKN